MKQIIIILTIILGILLLGVAGLFTWNQYEKNQVKKMEIENTQKNEDKKDNATKKTPSKKDNSNELANSDENNSTDTQVDGNNEITSTEEAVPEQEQIADGTESQPNNSVEDQPIQRPDPNTMSDDEFLETYKAGMSADEANTVDELAENPAYIEYLRGQIEAIENGQGGTY
ncbi:hypothetical protein BUY94_09800 [Mammaliicoccus fleurettii]|uniref:hypothetical protein n=1 Tax=Mammaliicoccus fleurettii TaxID=150056 RepID=UPI000D1CC381|nr:hypothetical protein [Mammaliicoccus fleurettii]PTE32689.1 hypothetical protein BUY94_09800 [Mammaliicoccus fleurettii]